MHPAFFPYLIGLVPILLAKTRPARIVAVCFGSISVAMGCYMVWAVNQIPDQSKSVQQVGRAVVIALSIAVVSSIVTYFVDKKSVKKP